MAFNVLVKLLYVEHDLEAFSFLNVADLSVSDHGAQGPFGSAQIGRCLLQCVKPLFHWFLLTPTEVYLSEGGTFRPIMMHLLRSI